MAKWILLRKYADFQAIANDCGVSVYLACLMRNRGVTDSEQARRYLYGSMKDLYDPSLLHDLDRAVHILRQKIRDGRKIRIIGDYDADGVCSSYILFRALSFLRADCDVALPERIRDGYGINERLVQDAATDGVDTIITCDNGIAAVQALRAAKESGLTVIVTDHHEIPYIEENDGKRYIYPPADAIVEPKYPAEEGFTPYPFRDLCGAAVAFKLAQVLLERPDISLPETDSDTKEQRVLRELLSFCGIATVCDVMPLVDENRILVRYGLLEARNPKNTGLLALKTAAGLSDQPLGAYHAGFVIGPCINAAGRLKTADLALQLFLETNDLRAKERALALCELNEQRKSMTEENTEAACALIDQRSREAGRTDRILVVRLEECHEALAGIVAGRLREKYMRPVIVLTPSMKDRTVLKGSGRSVDAYNLFEELHKVSDLLLAYGGHQGAAGVSLLRENEEELRRRLNAQCRLTEEEMEEELRIDMVLPPSCVTTDFVRELDLLEPTGEKNAKPLFVVRNLLLHLDRIVGKTQNVLQLTGIEESGQRVRMILFDRDFSAQDLRDGHDRICHVVYYPQINVFRGEENLQFVIRAYRVTGKA